MVYDCNNPQKAPAKWREDDESLSKEREKRVTASRIYYFLFLLCLFTSPYTPLGLKFFLYGSGFVFAFCMIFKRKSLKENFYDILVFISGMWI